MKRKRTPERGRFDPANYLGCDGCQSQGVPLLPFGVARSSPRNVPEFRLCYKCLWPEGGPRMRSKVVNELLNGLPPDPAYWCDEPEENEDDTDDGYVTPIVIRPSLGGR